jgi:hypothetical protein
VPPLLLRPPLPESSDTHVPAEHDSVDPHIRSQPPQSELLVLMSTHRLPQRVPPLAQLPPLFPPVPPELPFEQAPTHTPTSIAIPMIMDGGTAALSLLCLVDAIVSE